VAKRQLLLDESEMYHLSWLLYQSAQNGIYYGRRDQFAARARKLKDKIIIAVHRPDRKEARQ